MDAAGNGVGFIFSGLVHATASLSVLRALSTVSGEEEEGRFDTMIISHRPSIAKLNRAYFCGWVFISVIGMNLLQCFGPRSGRSNSHDDVLGKVNLSFITNQELILFNNFQN